MNKIFSRYFTRRLFCVFTVLVNYLFPGSLILHGASADSNIFGLDTRGSGSLTVTGRVLNKETALPLSGALVTLAEMNRTTGADGTFVFRNTTLPAGSLLSITANGFMSSSETVADSNGVLSVDMGDILLPPLTDLPVVAKLKLNPSGIFVDITGLQVSAEILVNWNGHEPGQVVLDANGFTIDSLTGPGPGYISILDISDSFDASTRPGNLSAVAVSAQGVFSEPFEVKVPVIAWPYFLQNLSDSVDLSRKSKITLQGKFPVKEKKVTLPVIGSFGWQFAAGAKVEYQIPGGAFQMDVGIGKEFGKSPKLILGDKEIESSFFGSVKGSATLVDGIKPDKLLVNAKISTKFELARAGMLDLFGPGITTFVAKTKGGEELVRNFSVVLYAKPSVDGTVEFAWDWPLDFKEGTVGIGCALEAAYEPKFGDLFSAKIYIGGKAVGTFGYPDPIFRNINFKGYSGLKATVWALEIAHEYVFLDYSFPTALRRLPLTGVTDIGTGYLVEAAGNSLADWAPISKDWTEYGPERFLLEESATAGYQDYTLSESHQKNDLFSRMGKAVTPGSVYSPPSASAERRIFVDPELAAQVDLPLIFNVLPEADPAMAADGNALMLTYVSTSSSLNPIQFTNISWTYFNGSAWSTPTHLHSDSRGQFNPQVAFDGNGDAIIVFERIKDSEFEEADLLALASQMEIVWSRWDHATEAWTAPEPLTDNSYLDHNPKLAGTLDNGDLLLVWTQNQANQLQGSGNPGDPENSRIMTARWNALTSTWGTPEILIDQITYEQYGFLEAKGQKAVYQWSQDLDGNLDDSGDTELFKRQWDENVGTWDAVVQVTSNDTRDTHARLVSDGSGNLYNFWLQGPDLVMDTNYSGTPVIVHNDADTVGFSDYALTVGPAGNLLLVWQEMNESGSDAHFQVYDPVSDTWSLDTLLSNDGDLESAFVPVWDSMGNLTIAYLNRLMSTGPVVVEIGGGGTIEVDEVPQPGPVELIVAKRALVKDLEIDANGFVATGTDFLPGDVISSTVTVTNSGNLAIENPVVRIYVGSQDETDLLIAEEVITGWLTASSSSEVTVQWTVPEPAIPRTLFAIVDEAGTVTEYDEDNNEQWIYLNGIDYQMEYLSGNVLRDGSVRCQVRVINRGAPASPVTTMNLWPVQSPGSEPLASLIVSLLNPGESVDMVFEMPPGSQMEGETSYRMVIDEPGLSGDILPENNELYISLNLWIDDDGDGIPRWWEETNGFSDTDPTDANLDSDGDRFTNTEEYLAGTDPNDASSFLKIGEFNTIRGQGGAENTFTISWASTEGGLYQVERSFDLEVWNIVGDNIPADPPMNTYVDYVSPGQSKVFYRISAK